MSATDPTARLALLEAVLQPFLGLAREVAAPRDPADGWKLGIPDDQAIFGACGARITAGDLRRLHALCVPPAAGEGGLP